MKPVRFVRNAPPYMAGEIAGFPDDQADKLIALGAAVEHQKETSTAPSEVVQPEEAPAVRASKKAGRNPR